MYPPLLYPTLEMATVSAKEHVIMWLDKWEDSTSPVEVMIPLTIQPSCNHTQAQPTIETSLQWHKQDQIVRKVHCLSRLEKNRRVRTVNPRLLSAL